MDSFFLRSPGLSLLHSFDETHRILQQNSTTGNYTGGPSDQQKSQDDAYEFVAFLLWYIFLVMCCVIPTCCAYRRRRMLEQRLADYQSNMTQSNNLFVLSNFQPGPHMRHRTAEQIQQERLVLLREELKATTMVCFNRRGSFESSKCFLTNLVSITFRSVDDQGREFGAIAKFQT
jgi:hypothetical protein